MRSSAVMTTALAITAGAAPTFPKLDLKSVPFPANALDSLSGYFNLIASKVQAAKVLSVAPTCDLSKAVMPNDVGLPPPTAGLKVHHVAVGRGMQNYTCDAGNADAAPKAAGAVATLFNVSCVAALYPDVLNHIPGMAVHFKVEDASRVGPNILTKSGVHYFKETTPFFDLNTPTLDIGVAPTAKNASADAPSTASVGQLGEKAVAWLKLDTKDGATQGMKEVYRVDTAGGSPPANCKDMAAKFEIEYSAVYWFWSE